MEHKYIYLGVIMLAILSFGAFIKKSETADAAYDASVCAGPPLSLEARYKAMDDGYDINSRYGCIDKASFAAVAEQRARVEAANTPEAIAKRSAEFAERKTRDAEEWARIAAAEGSRMKETPPNIVLRDIDVNTAIEVDIASVISVGPEVAAQIIEERNKRRFNDWGDLIHRVVGLSAAQTAAYASICGLNVDGRSLEGAPPDTTMAASIYQKYRHY